MARILSDTIIVAMIEAATRLASGRGPITGSSGQPAGSPAEAAAGAAGADEKGAAVQTTQAGDPGGTGATTSTTAHSPDALSQSGGSEHDTRTAAQIAADFKTIYTQLEDLVRSSAEQETRSVGFGIR